MFARRALAALLAALAWVVACERASAPQPDDTRTPTPIDRATTGIIEGDVRFDGAAPAPRRVTLDGDPTCAAAHPGGLTVADVRGDDGHLADAFVWVSHGLEDRVFAIPDTPVIVDQRGCLYIPRVVGVRAGQPIEFRNGDDTLHNVHGEPRQSSRWNFGLAQAGAARTLTLAAPEVMVPVRCDVHPWMRLDVGVIGHPYFAVTGPDGGFRLPDVPPGTYTITVWHARLGRREQSVTLPPQGVASVHLTYDRLDTPDPAP